jgi:hypothetical protein
VGAVMIVFDELSEILGTVTDRAMAKPHPSDGQPPGGVRARGSGFGVPDWAWRALVGNRTLGRKGASGAKMVRVIVLGGPPCRSLVPLAGW